MDCGSYREIVLLEHAVQVLERVHENRIRQQVQMDVMHFGFIMTYFRRLSLNTVSGVK